MRYVARIAAASLALSATAAIADPTFNAPPPAEGFSYPECYCTNRGVRVPIGAMSCLRIGSQEFTARCGMSLNNPAWRDLEEGCLPQPLSHASPDSEFVQPG
ncbi:MAG: hypothetical protein AAF360_14550 [Pseudomonadota bacterium]